VEKLTEGEKRRLTESADFLVAVVIGGEKDRTPPAYWSAAMRQEFARLVSTEQGRAALAAQLLGSWQRVAARQGGRP